MRKNDKNIDKEIRLAFKISKPVLAFGSQAKNTLCFAKGNMAYLSRVHADLSGPRDYLDFEKDVKYFMAKSPKVIAYDLHQDYQSTKLALSLFKGQGVQHHHAHIASCMAENSLADQKVIGVAFDGTGLGTDDSLWGAEFLICDYKDFTRAAHLKEVLLLGGERAIIEPWRLAASWLYRIYGNKFLDFKNEFAKKMDKKKWRILEKMYLIGFNSPKASSMGRLFDAVAAMVLVKFEADFEGQLAMELEEKATRPPGHQVRSYAFNIIKEKGGYVIDPALMFKEIIADLRVESKENIAYKFHFTVAQMIRKTCLLLRGKSKINKVVLSGGCFQNNILFCMARDLLLKERFAVITHKALSTNDSCISLGQVMIANARGQRCA